MEKGGEAKAEREDEATGLEGTVVGVGAIRFGLGGAGVEEREGLGMVDLVGLALEAGTVGGRLMGGRGRVEGCSKRARRDKGNSGIYGSVFRWDKGGGEESWEKGNRGRRVVGGRGRRLREGGAAGWLEGLGCG